MSPLFNFIKNMSLKFECFVEICGQKYEIIIEDKGFVIKFNEIYPKVQQIVKIGVNEDISFLSHQFQIIENLSQSSNLLVITNWGHFIEHNSRILITRKHRLISPLTATATALMDTQNVSQIALNSRESDVLKEEDHLLKSTMQIQTYHQIVMAINIGWDLKNVYNWEKVYQQMRLWLTTKVDENNFFVKNMFYHWTLYYINNYDKLNGRLSPKCQSVFNLLKIVHILDFSQFYDKTDKNFMRIINISKSFESKTYVVKQLKDIRIEKVLTKQSEENTAQNMSPNAVPSAFLWLFDGLIAPNFDDLGKPFDSYLRSKENILNEKQDNIALFNLVVMSINIGWDLRSATKNWDKVCQQIYEEWKGSVSALDCHDIFHKWTKFYTQNYYDLNGKIDLMTQKIFDLLKVVHILDLDKLYAKSDRINETIKSITQITEFNHYFNQHLKALQLKKIQSKEEGSVGQMTRLSPEVPQISQRSNGKDSKNLKDQSSRGRDRREKDKHKNSHNCVPNKHLTVSPIRGHQKDGRLSTTNWTAGQVSTQRVSYGADRPQDFSQGCSQSNNEETQLKRNENEIKQFYQIVLALNIGWDFRKNTDNWVKVEQTINERQFTAINCDHIFFFWAKFYAQNYEKLNDKLEPNTQKIFDFLKIIHTLDLHRFYSSSDDTALKIRNISTKLSFKTYFLKYLNQTRHKKVESKEKETMDRDERITHAHLTAYQQLLRFSKITSSDNSSNTTQTNSSQTGRTDSQRKRRSNDCTKEMNFNPKRQKTRSSLSPHMRSKESSSFHSYRSDGRTQRYKMFGRSDTQFNGRPFKRYANRYLERPPY